MDCVRAEDGSPWRRHAENGSTTQSTRVLPKHLAAYFTDVRREVLRVKSSDFVLSPLLRMTRRPLLPSLRRHAENGSTTQSTEAVPKHLAACCTDIRREILRVSSL